MVGNRDAVTNYEEESYVDQSSDHRDKISVTQTPNNKQVVVDVKKIKYNLGIKTILHFELICTMYDKIL